MAENQKIITGLKQFEISYLSNHNFSLSDGSLGQVKIDALQFDDGIFLGKINYPLSLVAGRFVDNVGFDMIILDLEDGTLPLRTMATYTKEGIQGQLYGTMTMLDVTKKNYNVADAIVSVKLETPEHFPGETTVNVYQTISRAADKVIEENGANAMLYASMLNSPVQEHINNIKKFYASINGSPLNPSFKFLDTVEFGDD